jgi:oligopeptidase B
MHHVKSAFFKAMPRSAFSVCFLVTGAYDDSPNTIIPEIVMRMPSILITLLSVFFVSACSNTEEESTKEPNTNAPESVRVDRLKQLSIPAPIAKKVGHVREYHGKALSDSYYWLKDQGYPEVNDEPIIDYLTEENAYFGAFLKSNEPLVDIIFEEFKGRTNQIETSVPWISNGYEYKWYYKEGEEYRTRSRKNLQTAEEEVFLSETGLAEGYDYFSLGGYDISQDNRFLTYSVNTDGSERYQLFIKDLQTGELLSDNLTDAGGGARFSSDSKSLIYSKLDSVKWRTKSINVHVIGTEQSQDAILLTEEDDGFFLGFGITSDEKFFVLVSAQREVQETYVVPADNLFAKPTMLVSRELGFSNSVDHAGGHFYILANDSHKNFRLAKVDDKNPAYEKWQTLIEGSDQLYLQEMQTFKNFIALQARENGIDQIRIRQYDGAIEDINFPEEVYAASLGNSAEFKQNFIRIDYESMITPETVFDYDVSEKTLITRKVQKIPSGYDKSEYVTERKMAPVRDGVMVPVSIVYKKGFKKDASQPLFLYGYGAYGYTVSPEFSTLRLSLLDRGFAYAIAHVRGSDMMGYQWYLDGKLKKRTNTFNDFVDVGRYLVKENYVTAGNISIEGSSAGGELIGAAVIAAPDLWRSATLGVPFVDVLNTMLDADLPLTPPEWKEWGNPVEDPDAYDLLLSYSPYDNIVAREYPPMFVSGGINDPRVTYWEPAKWTAKMREFMTDDNLLIMRINMGSGHFSNSGRYGRLRDYAEEYTFALRSHGITE